MAAKMLDEVLNKEKQTEEQEQKRTEEAQQIIDNARVKAKEILADAEKAAKEYEIRATAEAEKRAELINKEAEEKARAAAQLLKNRADGKFSEAVGAVREAISDK